MMSKKIAIVAAAVCLITVGASAQTKGSFTDPRDNQTYRTVTIGNQTWMAENLNYVTDSSWCYDNADSNCVKYGRLYNWDAAMTACPAGWRLPSDEDWDDLISAAGGDNTGTKLKSKTGWEPWRGISTTDSFGFSALPGGYRHSNNGFYDVGLDGYWWSVTEDDAGNAWYRYMDVNSNIVGRGLWYGDGALSVRCVHN